MERKNISSNTHWEEVVGYSRAVRVGQVVEVSGTTATDGDLIIGKGDAFEQAQFIFQKIERALNDAGAELKHVVRTRMYVTDIANWEAVAKAHGAYFKDIRPVATMVEICRLIDPDHLVEIEATAIISD